MKVAMVGLRGLGDGLGGVEKVVREVSTRLVQDGVDVTCYCRSRFNSDSEYQGVNLINIPTLAGKHSETAVYAVGAMMQAAKGDYDIIHVHALASSLMAWIPKWFSSKKVVISIHGLDWQRAKWGYLTSKILKAGEWSAVHYSHHNVCVSLSLQTYFRMRYLNHPFSYIPNGCDFIDEHSHGYTVPCYQDHQKDSYILFMGRIVPENGVHRLIEAFQ